MLVGATEAHTDHTNKRTGQRSLSLYPLLLSRSLSHSCQPGQLIKTISAAIDKAANRTVWCEGGFLSAPVFSTSVPEPRRRPCEIVAAMAAAKATRKRKD